MKALIVLLCLIGLTSLAQTQKIKIKKELRETKQSERFFFVTICDKYSGAISKKEIYSNNQLLITNNSEGLKIISYELVYRSRGKICSNSNMSNDSINESLKRSILMCDKNTHVVFQDIKAVSKNNDTIFLNPISLKLID